MIKNQKIKQSIEIDNKIIDLKLKLRYIMERKNQSTMEFFCSNQNLFIKYYDALMKMYKCKKNLTQLIIKMNLNNFLILKN